MSDDLIARARAHADLHPESASVIGELLDQLPPKLDTSVLKFAEEHGIALTPWQKRALTRFAPSTDH